MGIALLQSMNKNVMHNGKMQIICPHCNAIYDVPESRLDSIKSLHCSACNHNWAYATAVPAESPTPNQENQPINPAPVSSDPVASPAYSTVDPIYVVFPTPAAPYNTTDNHQPAESPPAEPQPFVGVDPGAAPIIIPPSAGIRKSQPPHPQRSAALRVIDGLLWIILLGLILLLIFILARHGITKLWPQSAKLYDDIGIS